MGYLGSLLVLTGMWFTGRKLAVGFLLGLLGETCWLVRGWTSGMADLVSLSAVFMGMYGWNFWRWTRE